MGKIAINLMVRLTGRLKFALNGSKWLPAAYSNVWDSWYSTNKSLMRDLDPDWFSSRPLDFAKSAMPAPGDFMQYLCSSESSFSPYTNVLEGVCHVKDLEGCFAIPSDMAGNPKLY